jgi:hypothetical protein
MSEREHAADTPPLSVLQNLAIVVDDPVPALDRRRHHRQRGGRIIIIDRPTSIVAPNRNLRTTISPKRNFDVGQQPQRRPAGRCRSVGVGARWIGAASRARVGAARRVNAVGCHCQCCRFSDRLSMTP